MAAMAVAWKTPRKLNRGLLLLATAGALPLLLAAPALPQSVPADTKRANLGPPLVVGPPLMARILPPELDEPPGKGETLPPPRLANEPKKTTPQSGSRGSANAPPPPPANEPWARGAQLIDLPAALRLAETANLDIAQAREVVNAARAAYDRARLGILPNFNIGSTYSKHEGNISKTEGNIIKANKDALFAGGGPSLAYSLSDALFAPLVAQQLLFAQQAGLQRVHNNILGAVADAYLNILQARRRLARVDETLDYLTSNQAAATRAGGKGLLPVVEAFYKAQVAEAMKAEVERVRVEIMRRREERIAAIQDYRVAAAELARLLRLDPEIPLWPVEDFRRPLPLRGDEWIDQPLEELVRLALNNRPELAENQALVQATVDRVRQARLRPLLPNAVVNYSWGDYGGGPDQISGTSFGPSGRILHFGTRDDLDASLIWRFQAFGLGDKAAVREEQALQRQAVFRQLQVRDQVVAQVVQAFEQVKGWRQRVEITRSALFDPAGAPKGPVFESVRLNFDRIRGLQKTRPLEVLDSIRGLSDTLDAYGAALTGYDQARFRLLVVMGFPLPPNPSPPPLPPAAGERR
jgi:outer membrane protein TolC